MGFLYCDTSALDYAYKAGGTALLDIFANTANARGFTLVITDVVREEVLNGSTGGQINAWLEANAVMVPTKEGRLLADHRAGLNAAYNPKNGGERSILELLTSDPKNAASSAIFTDDTGFLNTAALRKSSIQVGFEIERIVVTCGDMLNSAFLMKQASHEQFEKFDGSLKSRVNSYDPASPSYSKKLAGRIATAAQRDEMAAGRIVAGQRILGAFGKLIAIAGTAFVVVDGMTTAARAASEARAGHGDAAAETLSEFGGRVGGAVLFGELGLLVGGVPGALIGGIFGSFLGEQGARRLLHIVTGHADKDHISLQPEIDRDLTDHSVRTYGDERVGALQNDMYEAGYSPAEVNFVCNKVSEQLHGSAPHDGRPVELPDGPGEVFQNLAGTIPEHQAAFVRDPIVELNAYAEIISRDDPADAFDTEVLPAHESGGGEALHPVVESEPGPDLDKPAGNDRADPVPHPAPEPGEIAKPEQNQPPDEAPQRDPDVDLETDAGIVAPASDPAPDQNSPTARDPDVTQAPRSDAGVSSDPQAGPPPEPKPDNIAEPPSQQTPPPDAARDTPVIELDTHADIVDSDQAPQSAPDQNLAAAPAPGVSTARDPDIGPAPELKPDDIAAPPSQQIPPPPDVAPDAPVIELDTHAEIVHPEHAPQPAPDQNLAAAPAPDASHAPQPDAGTARDSDIGPAPELKPDDIAAPPSQQIPPPPDVAPDAPVIELDTHAEIIHPDHAPQPAPDQNLAAAPEPDANHAPPPDDIAETSPQQTTPPDTAAVPTADPETDATGDPDPEAAPQADSSRTSAPDALAPTPHIVPDRPPDEIPLPDHSPAPDQISLPDAEQTPEPALTPAPAVDLQTHAEVVHPATPPASGFEPNADGTNGDDSTSDDLDGDDPDDDEPDDDEPDDDEPDDDEPDDDEPDDDEPDDDEPDDDEPDDDEPDDDEPDDDEPDDDEPDDDKPDDDKPDDDKPDDDEPDDDEDPYDSDQQREEEWREEQERREEEEREREEFERQREEEEEAARDQEDFERLEREQQEREEQERENEEREQQELDGEG